MIELGLARIFRLLAPTPLPWRALHIAGTNGKGSICAYVSAMLSAYNASQFRIASGKPPIKHGRFTSPHLIDRWDCISINGKTISESIFKQVEARVMERNKLENIQASEFELLTATAFEIFTQENVDVGVIEVGMGGRLDSTNILGQTSEHDEFKSLADFRPKPLVTAISTIALDHQGFLGNTLIEIATEKAGILKAGVPLVLAFNDESVVEHILGIAKQTGVTEIHHSKDTEDFNVLQHSTTTDAHDARQQNGAMAYTVTWLALQRLGRLAEQSSDLTSSLSDALKDVPASLVWPGRLQDISIQAITGYTPIAVLDGAHNVESATVLANTVRERAGKRPIVWVLAASQGKDVKSMFKLFLGERLNDHVVATEFGPVDGMPWVKSMPAEEVKATAAAAHAMDVSTSTVASTGSYLAEANVEAALQRASELAQERDGVLVIAGSLYLVGDVLRLVGNHGGKME